MVIQAGTGGVYEILLIVLVIILIFNGLLRQKIMKKVHDSMETGNANKVKKPENKIDENHEYIDFEEIKDN